MLRKKCCVVVLATLFAAGSAQTAFSQENSIKIDLTKSRERPLRLSPPDFTLS